MAHDGAVVDPRSGFCQSNSIFYSKRRSVLLPSVPYLDVTTYIASRPHTGEVALVDASTGRKITYPELWRAVHAVAASLSQSHGVRKGDVVLILSPNSIYFPVVALAVMSIGGVLTTTNPLNTPGEIAKQVSDSKSRFAFTTSALLSKLSTGAAACLPVVILDSDAEPPRDSRVVSSIKEMMASGSGRRAAKGVASTHRNLISMTEIIINRFKLDGSVGGNNHVFLCTVPMFHIFGLVAFATGMLGSGSTVVVLSKFEMGEMMSAIATHRVTYLPLVPPILVAMTQHAQAIRARYDLSSLKSVLSGGAPLSREGYGLTESTGIGASTDSAEESRRFGTAGMLSPNTQARIVDPDTGESLPMNRSGELWLRGPYVMKGYFSNPEATASTLNSEGWLRTGDLCYIDEDGFLFVVDRLKELIKYKGYQVAPAELEALLHTHPDILDAAVIPFPDREVGQFPMAYVVRKEGSRLSEAERIRRVAFVSAIPKNPSGKILRKDLIKLATSKI
ncbi:unnamed protein product [Spirodela intermedia]|uniref:Uncharacterized protein n=1 Tax=Spirodela intermedia TaxID=51605 RepID=A0A7I8IFA9_SPIIN|nr:unnamed protein product [Spirodela intermedia]CAA6656075.1 unnamed protein product [Spirodela intermedia]